jgi:nitrite reductase/ring-hydroxylating ferredoxin subunit
MSAPPAPLGRYERRVRASEARLWENVLDWEHLPWLHRHAFVGCERLPASREGWRARVRLPPADAPREILLELEVERAAGRYVARTREGPGAGTEIWTRVLPVAPDATDVEVEFHVPGVEPAERARLAAAYRQLYARLWDEDEAMMRRRQEVLDAGLLRAAPAPGTLPLGPAAALRARAPLVVRAGTVPLRIVACGDALFAHSAICPHFGGPLEETSSDPACVRCPWHGYRFDVRDGASADGRPLRLPFARRLDVDERGEASLALG